MRLIVISLFALFISLMLVIAGNSYLMTLLGVRLAEVNTPPSEIGWIMTFYSIGFVAGTLFAPRLLIRVGHIRAFAALASLASIAALSYPFANDFWTWSVLRALGGMSVAGLFIAIESWFSAVASENNRATLFSLYTITAYSASAGGQVILASDASAGEATAFILAGLLLIFAVIPLSVSRLQSPPIEHAEFMTPQRLWRKSAVGVFSSFCGGLLISSFYALVPLYATLNGITKTDISSIMSVSVMSAMALAWPIGWICDRMTRSNVLIGVVLIAALACFLIAQFSDQVQILLIASSLFMAMIAGIYSIAVAITNDRIRSEERVAASSTLYLSYGLGSIVGPLGGSYLLEAFIPAALFYGFLVLLILLAMFILLRQAQKPPVPVEEQEDFVPAMPETQVNSEFDPRTEDLPDTAIEELFPEAEDETSAIQHDESLLDSSPSVATKEESVINEVFETVEDISETFSISESIKQASAEEQQEPQSKEH